MIELVPGAEDNGLASMLAGLVEQNLADHPLKRRAFERMKGRVAIVVEDAGVAMTLEFDRGSLRVHDGIAGIPDVTVRADADDVMNMNLVELEPRFGLPDPRGKVFQQISKATREGRVRIYGMLLHIPLMLRLQTIMSVA